MALTVISIRHVMRQLALMAGNQLNEGTGKSEVITRIVPRTQAIKSYFDVHNHLRQGSLHI